MPSGTLRTLATWLMAAVVSVYRQQQGGFLALTFMESRRDTVRRWEARTTARRAATSASCW